MINVNKSGNVHSTYILWRIHLFFPSFKFVIILMKGP